MNSTNQKIHIFLKYYCDLPSPPEYAVLIKGKWGTGKTWFIKNLINDLNASNIKSLHISLYGMTTFDEIENEFFRQLHPVLSSKKMALAGKVIKGLLKTTLKIDFGKRSWLSQVTHKTSGCSSECHSPPTMLRFSFNSSV